MTHSRSMPAACALVGAAGIACALATPARAQSPWLDRDRGNVLQIETLAPDPVLKRAFPTWTWFLDGRTRIAGPLWFVGDMAFTHFHPVANGPFDTGTSQNVLGNPYLGVELSPRRNGPRVGVGVRPHIVNSEDDLALLVGRATDLAREDAYLDGSTVYRASVGWRRAPPARGGFGFDAEASPAVWTAPRSDPPQPAAHVLGYTGTVRYGRRSARLGVGVTGRWRANTGGLNFGAASEHQLDLALDVGHARVRPAFELLVPIDPQRREIAGNTWGLSLAITPH